MDVNKDEKSDVCSKPTGRNFLLPINNQTKYKIYVFIHLQSTSKSVTLLPVSLRAPVLRTFRN